MKIYIPTRGRRHKQIFFNALPEALKQTITFVGNSAEDFPEDTSANYEIAPSWVKNIGDKRHFIVHELHNSKDELLVMCDDDLRLNKRRLDDPTKFAKMLPDDYISFFLQIGAALKTYAHVTVMPREGGNRNPRDVECGRAMRVLGYDVKIARKECVDFTRCPTKEDFDATLQLLRAGHKNLVLANFVQDDGGGSNAAGGCSIYRDAAYMTKTAEALAKLHPRFVKVVQKTTKGAWGGGTRTDVNIQWKSAYQSSQS